MASRSSDNKKPTSDRPEQHKKRSVKLNATGRRTILSDLFCP